MLVVKRLIFLTSILQTILGMFRKSLKSDRIVAHFNLIIALILFHVVQLFSYSAEKSKDISATPCITVTFLGHFFLLAVFMWMLCEGITLHFSVVDVFSTHAVFKVMRYIVGWGISFIIALSTLVYGLSSNPYPTCYVQGVGKHSCNSNGEENLTIIDQQIDPDPSNQLIERCWLSVNNYLILALFVPVTLVLIINTALMIRVFLLISESSKATDRKHQPSIKKRTKNFNHFKKSLKGVVILMPILGVPWVFGVIPQSMTHVAFLYVFTLLNSTQGIFMLLFYCILNHEVRNVITRCLRKRKQLWYFQQSTITQHTQYRHQSVDSRNKCDDEAGQRGSLSVFRSASANSNVVCEAPDPEPPSLRGESNADSGCFLPERDDPSPTSSSNEKNDNAFLLQSLGSDNEFGRETFL